MIMINTSMMNKYLHILFLTLIAALKHTDVPCQVKDSDFSMVPGVVINHRPASLDTSLGSPSITIMSNGDYIVSQTYSSISKRDKGNTHLTGVFRSSDRGLTWEFLTKMDKQRWSTIFFHNEALYLMGTDTAFGNITIRKSTDGGKTWTVPENEETGLISGGRNHCAPVPLLIHNGRIWRAMEDALQGREFRAFMMSAPVDADLLKAESWTFTNKLPYKDEWIGGKMRGWLEGNAVLTPDNEIVNILRCSYRAGAYGRAAMVHISKDGTLASFDETRDFIRFPGASKKFTIRYDPESRKYWSLVNWIQPGFEKYLDEPGPGGIRNTMALTSSTDLKNWVIERIVLYHPDIEYHAFQYADWVFDGDDIIAVSRTAFDDGIGGAANFHDANFITFHRIRNFRHNFNHDPEEW
jgi:hypothetical protein